jgi:hypothetical protein
MFRSFERASGHAFTKHSFSCCCNCNRVSEELEDIKSISVMAVELIRQIVRLLEAKLILKVKFLWEYKEGWKIDVFKGSQSKGTSVVWAAQQLQYTAVDTAETVYPWIQAYQQSQVYTAHVQSTGGFLLHFFYVKYKIYWTSLQHKSLDWTRPVYIVYVS